MSIDITWGRGDGATSVSTVADLDATLDTISHAHAEQMPYCVTLIAPGAGEFPVMLDICVGHPERSIVYHIAADGSSGWGYQPDLEPGARFSFDYAGTPTDAWPERTRVTDATARQAARQFLTSGGQRPDALAWETDE
ncbi:Imm1 family immunity protein [Micromonospora sp. WMMC250]|uniref:Imm1 family immunity protein n=1 Tax=Micromonospora sp. WMMC250 TaxID=3014781 RepID=UPI0022B7526F|nr:Imm1 family immunity protein [Micromonospora sp. WMMC250]MCZ7379795.1 Imm1 family immunity protein [Micromonospora sp. WMMC250]